MSSFGWMKPSRFPSVQQVEPAAVLHAPLFWLLPQVSEAVLNRPDKELANVIFVA
jgi:hypothetical protein